MKIINFKILFLLLFISLNNCIIVIPFKTFINKEPENFNSSDVLFNWGKNIIYSNTLIGTPPQNISIIINSEIYSTELYPYMCDIAGSSYQKDKSSTFKVVKIEDSSKNISKINETIYFYDNLKKKELIPLYNYSFKYLNIEKPNSDNINEYHENTCINIGLKLSWGYYTDKEYNLIEQLKGKYNDKNIETYEFSFKYNSESEGEIIIGLEPHYYDPDNYFYSQYRTVGALSQCNNYQKDFSLNFDKTYISYKNKTTGKIENDYFFDVCCLEIKFDKGNILGTSDYEKKIRKIFFDDLINDKKCFVDTVIEKDNTHYNVYYCNKDSTEKIIKNEFPKLYFEMKQFNEIFELDYKDLFRAKNDKIYFLVYFKQNSYYANYFEIGSIFLKKYFFTFNQNTKNIGYYNEKLPGGKKKKNNKIISFMDNKVLVVVIIILVIIFVIVGFFLGKIVYDKVRKPRLNEVDDNYDYYPQENDKNKDDKFGINEE